MNNVHYVVVSVEGCAPAARALGVDWLERHKDAVEDWGAKYHEATWMPLVALLKVRARHAARGQGRGRAALAAPPAIPVTAAVARAAALRAPG